MAFDDVIDRILDGRTPLTITYGRDQNRALSPTRVGEAGFELNNIDRALSPENTSSPLYGEVYPGRDVTITATLSGTTTTLFRGFLDDFTIQPGTEQRSVDASCLDGLSKLRGLQVSTGIFQGLRTGEALHKLLDAAGWDPAARDIDYGATVIPHWWVDNGDAFDAALELVDSEGPYALITCDGDGKIVFRDRHHRLVRAASLTAQSTWYSRGSVEPLFSAPAEYDHGWKDIVNVVSFEVPIRVPTANLDVVWSSPGRITIGPGQTLPVTIKGSNPFVNAVTPVAGIDYTNTGTVTVSMPRTSGESTTLFITATGTAATIDDLQVRGYALETAATIVVSDEDTSVTKYGRRSSTSLRTPVWAGVHDAAAIVQLVLAQRGERLPTIRATLINHNSQRQFQQLNRDLSDRVRIVEYETGLNADCWIEQISHTVSEGGLNHRTTFGLEKAPVQVANVFILGTSLLGTGILGRRGFADPNRIFILGSATNGQLGNDILAA